MLFSIIVPVYNVEKYLKECVESILNQDQVEYELILVDDGSKDNSGVICDEFAQKYANVVVIHKENGGLSDARNAGIKKARGKYILFVDGDDCIAKNSLIEISKIIKSENMPDLVCLELTKFFDDSAEKVPMNDGIDEKINCLQGEELFEYWASLPKYPASACTKAIKRSLFQKNDLYFVKGLLCEDLEWGIRLFLSVKNCKYCSNEYYFYRQARKGSLSNSPSEKRLTDILNTFCKWVSYADTLEQNGKRIMICSFMEYIFRLILLGYESVENKNRVAIKKQLKTATWVLGTRKDSVSKCIRVCYKMLGIQLTSKILKRYLNIRGY